MISTSALRPSTKAVFEVGKSMLEDSISVGRDFAKFMISVSTGAIPVYLGLIGLLGIKTTGVLVWFLPPGFFGLAAVIFVVAFPPKLGDFDIEVVQSIQETRTRIIADRNRNLIIGMIIFMIAVAASAYLIIDQPGGASKTERGHTFEWIEVAKDASADQVNERLEYLRQRIATAGSGATVEFRELILTDSTIIIAIIESERAPHAK